MSKKDRKKQREELLGMSMSSAEKKLRKAIIHEFATQLKKNICRDCGRPIDDPDDLAITHVEDWEDEPTQFFNLTNVAFGHVSCGAEDHGRRQGAREMRTRVEVIVEDQNGQPLRGCVHGGQVYVAGERDQRYQVRVRNTTNQRLVVVLTVDGRNVETGKPGSWDDRGQILEPYAQWTFTGWRQSDDAVAAFRLGTADDSYSAQMGSPQNVGIIGVAVFEEKQLEKPIITVKEKEYVPVPYPYPVPAWPRVPQNSPWWQYPWQTIIGDRTTYGGGYYGNSTGSSFEVQCSSQELLTTQLSCSVGNVQLQGQKGAPLEQQLGTEYGETLQSKVKQGSFNRATAAPCELIEIRYDSLESLVAAGIMSQTPPVRKSAPRAFPSSPEVAPGYCAPPPRRREHR